MDGDAYCENDQKSEGLLRLSVPAEVAQQRLTGARGQERRHGERASRSSRSLTSDSSSALLARSYQFLAPRFMPVTEWISPQRFGPGRKEAPITQMAW